MMIGNNSLGRPVEAELVRREQRIRVGAEAVERDEAEVEQTREADGDIQAEREQGVDERVDADADHVLVAGQQRNERGREEKSTEADAARHALERAPHPPGLAPLVDLGDPAVHPDLRRLAHTFLMSAFPEQACRAHEEHGDQEPEDDQVVERRGQIAGRERLGEADDEPAEHRAGDASDPADDGRGESFEPGDEAHEVVDALEHEPDHDARCAGERGADEERHDDHAVDVDAHHRRRLPVVGGRAHRLAEPRAGDEEREPDHQRDGGDDHDDANQRDVQRSLVDALHEERAVIELERPVGAKVGREEQQRRVLEKERHAQRSDQRCDPRRVAQRPVGEALDHDAEQPRARSSPRGT